MPKPNDLSLTTFEQDSTLIAVIEMSLTSWLIAAILPGIERHPLKKLDVDEGALLQLLHRWRDEAINAGREITKVDDYPCRQAFRHFMSLLNRAVYGAAFRRYGKRLRVLPVLERGELHARALRSWERGTSGRWHIHCAIELPSHFDAVALENLICHCWAKVE